jgi:tetratricopeptide (TPR) repeat protein
MRTGAWAVAESPDRVEGRFWLGVNLSIAAQELGRLKAMRAILEAKAELKKAEKIAPAYHGAGPLRVLGRIYHKAPWFVGGSNKRSRQYYDRALEIAPSNSVTLIYAAELALDMKEHERAVSLLEKIISSPIDPEWEHENLRDRRLAENLLDRLRKG